MAWCSDQREKDTGDFRGEDFWGDLVRKALNLPWSQRKSGGCREPSEKDEEQLSLGRSGACSWSGMPRSLWKKFRGEGCGAEAHSDPPAEVGTLTVIAYR